MSMETSRFQPANLFVTAALAGFAFSAGKC
jgi:hypothetical protein